MKASRRLTQYLADSRLRTGVVSKSSVVIFGEWLRARRMFISSLTTRKVFSYLRRRQISGDRITESLSAPLSQLARSADMATRTLRKTRSSATDSRCIACGSLSFSCNQEHCGTCTPAQTTTCSICKRFAVDMRLMRWTTGTRDGSSCSS